MLAEENMTKLILASGSPRRANTMEKITDEFEIIVPDIEEKSLKNEKAEKFVMRLASEKAMNVFKKSDEKTPVLGADTIVWLDEIIGKPNNSKEAEQILKKLSGKKHTVMTGVALILPDKKDPVVFVEKTHVFFNPISQKEMNDYIQSGEPIGKAGAYAIQGIGGIFVSKIEGCYYNVMGFPLSKIYSNLKKYKVI